MKILYFSVSCLHPYSCLPQLPFSLAWILTPPLLPLLHSFLIQLEAKVIFFFFNLTKTYQKPFKFCPPFLEETAHFCPAWASFMLHLLSLRPRLSAVSDLCFLAHSSLHLWLLSLTKMLFSLFIYLGVYSFFKHQFFVKSFLGLSA